MAQATFNLSDRQLRSEYWAYYYESGVKATSTPSTATSSAQSITVPAHSSINWVKIYCSLNNPLHGTSIRQVLEGDDLADDLFTNGSALNKTLFAAGTRSIKFKFKSSTSSTNYPGHPSEDGLLNISQLNITNIRIVIDYNPPASGLTLNKTSCKAGAIIRASISAASSSYSHKAKFAMSGVTTLTYALAAGVTYKDFTIPLEWQEAFPSATSRTVTVTLESYNGSTMTGDVSKTFSMTLSDDNYPSITAFDLTRIPGFEDEDITAYVQGFSQVQLTGTAVGLYGATISRYKYTLGTWISTAGNDVTTPVLVNTGVRTVTLEVTDSRGRKARQDQTFEVIPYTQPALDTPVVRRSDALGVGAVNGTYVYICSGISLSSLGLVEGVEVNEATLKARVYQKGNSPPAWDDVSIVTLTPETPAILSGALTTSSYTIDLLVTDKLSNYMYTTEIPTAMALLTGLKGISGIIGAGIGLFAERVGALTAKWPIWVNDDPVCKYEVGQLYISKDPTSPATKYPGTTWEPLDEGTYIMAGGATYVPGEASGEVGSATHQHTVDGRARIWLSTVAHKIYMKRVSTTAWTATHENSVSGDAGNTDSHEYAVEVVGTAASTSNLPPSRAYYMWERTA